MIELPLPECPPDFQVAFPAIRTDSSGQTVRFYSDEIDNLKTVADHISSGQYYLRQSTLEDVFLKATGRMLNEKQ